MYFSKLDSRDVNPAHFVNRTPEVTWLTKNLEGYLDTGDARLGRAFRVTGTKGSGKTIFVRNVLKDLRQRYAKNTLFVEVDCRRGPGSREVFNKAAQGIVNELLALERAGAKIKPELIKAAQVLSTITRFSDVELKEVQEHLIQYKEAVGLSSRVALLSNLNANFGISLDRKEEQIKKLVGSIRLDEYRICCALREFFTDIRDQKLNVVLFVDNIDELDHDYRDPSRRRQIRQQAEWVLELRQAPVAMIACMRTYFADIARDIGNKLTLESIPDNVLFGILEQRIKVEPQEVQEEFQKNEVNSLAHMLAKAASTPLAYLEWFKFLSEQEAYDKQRRKKAVERFVRAEYAGVAFEVVEQVVRAFQSPERELDHAELMQACRNNEAEAAAVQDLQVVLPNDFWSPSRFSLDPSLHILFDHNNIR